MKARIHRIVASILAIAIVLQAYSALAAENHDDLFVYIGSSLMQAKEGDIGSVSENIAQFEEEWEQIKQKSELASVVDKSLAELKQVLHAGGNEEEIRTKLSALSTALIHYDQEQNPLDTSAEKEKLNQLLPFIDEMQSSVEREDAKQLKEQYDVLFNKWLEVEKAVAQESSASYGRIETNIAFIRIAVSQEPTDFEKATTSLEALKAGIEDFLSGEVVEENSGNYELKDVVQLLAESLSKLSEEQVDSAIEDLSEILFIWPMVEGEVSTRDSKLYNDMETKVPMAISLLQSKQAKVEEAKEIVSDLHERIQPLLTDTSYSAWDAALILLREGLEALIIIATFLSFLKRVGQENKQKWIWGGVIAGLVASIGLAVAINLVFSQVTAASNREYIEGITGITAVAMMLTVGAWLHSKSNIQLWNRYINKHMNQALATGSLISFALISFLSIFREGAETIIFYTGMAPSMKVSDLLTGIAVATVILLVLAYFILRYSMKLPITPFLKVTTFLIYAIAFKILGVSIHSLQVSQIISTHSIEGFPFVDWLGLYPTYETFIPQIVLLIIVVGTTIIVKRRSLSS